jgi:hypothetical protein
MDNFIAVTATGPGGMANINPAAKPISNDINIQQSLF